ncbi:MAG: hypothetical protein L3J69_03230 [Desulfobacula sp.]|nr:hypothetical protein [Desulfobacula sp.]
MINFCEDCGKKNTLEPKEFREGKAVFKCMHCGYFNAYKMDSPKTGKLGKINLFLKNNLTDPIIIGAFIFHLKTRVVINHMPGILKDSDLAILGKLLTDSYTLCHMQYTDIDELTLHISEKLVTIQMIDHNIAIVFVTKKSPLPKKIKKQFSDLISTI